MNDHIRKAHIKGRNLDREGQRPRGPHPLGLIAPVVVAQVRVGGGQRQGVHQHAEGRPDRADQVSTEEEISHYPARDQSNHRQCQSRDEGEQSHLPAHSNMLLHTGI